MTVTYMQWITCELFEKSVEIRSNCAGAGESERRTAPPFASQRMGHPPELDTKTINETSIVREGLESEG
jgi:hypothetical protein